MMRPPALSPLVALAAIAACAHVDPDLRAAGEAAGAAGERAARKAGQALSGPHLSEPAVVPMPLPDIERSAPNSLWRGGARAFFNDQRAARVGDILTVEIEIEDRAELSNSTSRSRDARAEAGIGAFLGKEESLGRLLPPGGNFDPSRLFEGDARSDASGEGEISRVERVELTVAAIVAEVLPNGNFVVSGRQEVRINNEIRDLTVSGVIRPEDISADNTVRHTQMAEARISYGGRGTLSAVQRPRWGQRLADWISPW